MTPRTAALKMLRSQTLFQGLKDVFFALGPGTEVKFAIAMFLVFASRFRENPLRIRIEQRAKDNANHLVRRVAKLLPEGSIAGLSGDMDKAWKRFEAAPERKIFFIPPQWELSKAPQPRIEVHSNQLQRVDSVETNGRTAEAVTIIERPFVCILVGDGLPWKDQARWLTMDLGIPRAEEWYQPSELQPSEFEVWHAAQDLIEERLQIPILMPQWEEIVMEKICAKDYASRQMPALLGVWKTMCALRSFSPNDENAPPKVLCPTFEDYAAGADVLRAAFLEGRKMPSAKYIFSRISAEGDASSVVNPITGAGRRYRHSPQAIQFEALFDGGPDLVSWR